MQLYRASLELMRVPTPKLDVDQFARRIANYVVDRGRHRHAFQPLDCLSDSFEIEQLAIDKVVRDSVLVLPPIELVSHMSKALGIHSDVSDGAGMPKHENLVVALRKEVRYRLLAPAVVGLVPILCDQGFCETRNAHGRASGSQRDFGRTLEKERLLETQFRSSSEPTHYLQQVR